MRADYIISLNGIVVDMGRGFQNKEYALMEANNKIVSELMLDYHTRFEAFEVVVTIYTETRYYYKVWYQEEYIMNRRSIGDYDEAYMLAMKEKADVVSWFYKHEEYQKMKQINVEIGWYDVDDEELTDVIYCD